CGLDVAEGSSASPVGGHLQLPARAGGAGVHRWDWSAGLPGSRLADLDGGGLRGPGADAKPAARAGNRPCPLGFGGGGDRRLAQNRPRWKMNEAAVGFLPPPLCRSYLISR